MTILHRIQELAEMISSAPNQEEVKDKAWEIFRSHTEIPQAHSRKGYGYFSDDEKEFARLDVGEDIRLHATANVIGLAFDLLEGR